MNDRAAAREEYENRINRAYNTLRIEREIYNAVFCCRTPVPNPLPGNTVLDACQKRLKKAEHQHQRAIRYEDLTKCGRCEKEGIGEDDEKEDDDRTFEIFALQTDSDSFYYDKYLCVECMASNDRYMAQMRGER